MGGGEEVVAPAESCTNSVTLDANDHWALLSSTANPQGPNPSSLRKQQKLTDSCKQIRSPFTRSCIKPFVESLLCLTVVASLLCPKALDLLLCVLLLCLCN